ncbi:MAG: DNA-formamidopyrimidine glycosylase [Leptospiraceae bacterium]|nr:DNA-formamidopyrimidine glycosylase [Leptospiraceae bacterium]
MPELPDLEYVRPILEEELVGKQLRGIEVFEPVVLRNMIGGSLGEFSGLVFRVLRHGPFLTFALEKAAGSAPGVSKKAVAGGTGSRAGTRKPSDDLGGIPEPPGNSGGLTQKADEGLAHGLAIIVHPMLAGRFRLNGKKQSSTAIRFHFEGFHLDYLDDRKMGKVYVCKGSDASSIPGYGKQGIDLLSSDFNMDYFLNAAKKSKKQARVFIMDQSVISSIGNAYADEILFEARIHPKTRMNQLGDDQRKELFQAIKSVIAEGIRTIQEASPDLEMKYREHMKVRNRKGEPCPDCGTSIRRANVLGYDSFFCPSCQPDGGKGFIDWSSLPGKQD